jgi:hypothetical protein
MKKPSEKAKEQDRSQQQPEKPNTREKEFSEAIERVYRHYGNNLTAFFRDAQKELVKRG